MSPEPPDDDIRVGTPERERAISLLNDAFSSGYLEIAEFEERSGLVYAARTRGELRRTLDQLPIAGRLFPDALGGVAAGLPPAVTPAIAPLSLDADWDTVRRKGSWLVPPMIVASGEMGTIDLDFTQAQFSAPTVQLDLQTSVCTVKLRLGADHEVRYDTLDTTGWSKVKDKAGPPRRPGGPLITLSGRISGASGVTIKRA